jgi:hypothetical protein
MPNVLASAASDKAQVMEFLDKITARPRLIFALDATMSRQGVWDMACQLQNAMFAEVNKISGLEVQLLWYRGASECKASNWTRNANDLARAMRQIRVEGGYTQIGRMFAHIKKEHAQQPISCAILVGDAVEETPDVLFGAAQGLPPLFLFQEGQDEKVAEVFKQLARITRGAHCQFDAGAARELADLLRAVARFAVGGVKALQDLHTDSARKLLGQIK